MSALDKLLDHWTSIGFGYTDVAKEARAELAELRHNLDAANALLWIETNQYPNPMQLWNEDGDWMVAVCGHGDKQVTFIDCEQDKPYGIPSLSPESLAKVKTLMFDDEDGDTRYWDEDIGGDYNTREINGKIRAAVSAERERCAKIAEDAERIELGFQKLAHKSRDAQRASDFQEGASVARSIASTIRAGGDS